VLHASRRRCMEHLRVSADCPKRLLSVANQCSYRRGLPAAFPDSTELLVYSTILFRASIPGYILGAHRTPAGAPARGPFDPSIAAPSAETALWSIQRVGTDDRLVPDGYCGVDVVTSRLYCKHQ
jgi:hypothetical protein